MKAMLGEKRAIAASALGMMVLLTGCARYQYSLVQPPNAAQVIGKEAARVEYPPLMYQLAERNRRLAVQINNPTDTPVTILANRSYLVTPQGETRPVPGTVIAPHSYIGMVFPPAPLVYRAYPSFSWGMGFGYPFYSRGPYGLTGLGLYSEPYFYGPTDYHVPPPNNWEWKEGNVRMLLFYQQATNTFEHQFLFNRVKVK